MRPATAVAAVLVVLAVVLSFVTGSKAPHPAPASVGTAAVVNATLVCPVVDSSPTGTTTQVTVADVATATTTSAGAPPSSSGTVTATTLAGSKSTTSALKLTPTATIKSKSGLDSAVAITATGSVAATLVADQVQETPDGRFRALAGGPCVSPQTDWWFTGVDGRVGYDDSLVLANAAKSSAEVGVTLWTRKGPVSAPHLDAIALNPQSRTVLRLAAVAPNDAVIGMHVHADSGAVAAAVVERRTSAIRSDGGDLVPPTAAPAKSAVIAGFARGAGDRYLYVSNPGDLIATVSLKLVAGSGSFTPSGVNQVEVKDGHSTLIDLTKVFGTLSGAVQLTSDQPIFAQGMSSLSVTAPLRPDRVWLAAVPAIRGTTAVANGHEPDGGQCLLLLSAPGAAASVKVATPSGHSTTVTVPAGKSVEVDITSTVTHGSGPWPFTVTSTGGPVYGVRMLNFGGAHGALVTSEPLTALPRPIPLPPVRSDPRIAVK